MNTQEQVTFDFEQLGSSIADDLRAKGYSIQPQALPGAWVDELYHTVKTMPPRQFKAAGVGRADQHLTDETIRKDQILWIEGHDGAQGNWLHFAACLQRELNRRLLLGLFSFESHFAHYRPGAFYKTHVDSFKGQANRVLSVVLYLNPEWAATDGGEMILYSETEPAQELCRVTPLAGTLAVFLSEDFPHEVRPAKRDRFSIAGWYRVNGSSMNRVDPPA